VAKGVQRDHRGGTRSSKETLIELAHNHRRGGGHFEPETDVVRRQQADHFRLQAIDHLDGPQIVGVAGRLAVHGFHGGAHLVAEGSPHRLVDKNAGHLGGGKGLLQGAQERLDGRLDVGLLADDQQGGILPGQVAAVSGKVRLAPSVGSAFRHRGLWDIQKKIATINFNENLYISRF